ncbi:MAG TPA: MarR family transcriptional regulator [Chloroflexota bacterium]|jgi:MarR family transcriptional regulator for hemolysin|nr:MarR family transcriptional regulator [Chloroflexota bacterium]
MAARAPLEAGSGRERQRQEFLEGQPTYWLKRSFRALRRRVDTELRPFGITLSQRDALLSLEHAGPASHGALADRLGLEQSSISRLVDGLTRRSLVSVHPAESDKRSRVIAISDEGREILQQTPGSSRIAGTLLAETLSQPDTDRLVSLLRRATEALEA